MRCSRCQAENREGRRFCAECGAPLALGCPACGFANEAGEKFCGGCGAPLAAAPAHAPLPSSPAPSAARFGTPESYTPKHLAEKILTSRSALEGERKQVTVLFADLKGSMELLADRDPEEARKILDPVLGVRTLVETKLLVGSQGGYRLARPVEGLRVPATVQAVLAARIDRLPGEEKQLLQTAAVIGKDVPVGLLQAVTATSEEGLRSSLAHLQAAEFLYEASLYPDWEFTFKHALTHEVAYTSLLQDRRTTLHGRVVEAIERLYGDRLTEQVERLAQHASRGGLWAKAAVYFREAGAKAAGRSAHREAVDCLDQALAALGHLPESRETIEQAIDLRLELRNSLWPLGEVERMAQRLAEAEALAETLGDQLRLGQVSAQRTQQLYLTGQPDRAVEAGRRALAIATALGDLPLEVAANFYLGNAHYSRGEYLPSIDFCRRNLEALGGELARERFGLPGLASVLSRVILARSFAERGEFTAGSSYAEEAIRLAEAADHPYSVGAAHFWSGLLYLRQGDLLRAVPLLERGLELCRLGSIVFLLPQTASALGCTYALLGRNADAEPLLEEAQECMARMRGLLLRPLVHVWVGEARLHGGLLDEAFESATRALAIAREHHELGHEGWALRLLGEVVSHRDSPDVEKAEEYYREALALADELGMRPLKAHCHLGLGKLYRRSGDRTKAQEHLTTATALLREMEMRFWLEQAEAELKELG